jgi:hypothetical protein
VKMSKAHRAAGPRHPVRGRAGGLSLLRLRSGRVDLAWSLWPDTQKNTQRSAKQKGECFLDRAAQIVPQSHVLPEGHGTPLDAEVANVATTAGLGTGTGIPTCCPFLGLEERHADPRAR